MEIIPIANPSIESRIIWIDHRDENDEIVEQVSALVNSKVKSQWKEDKLYILYDGQKFEIPLTFTGADRYITVSSLAELLKDTYSFWVVSDSLKDDTQGLLVIEKDGVLSQEESHLKWFYETFSELKRGYDYFNGISIPYLGHEKTEIDIGSTLNNYERYKAEVSKALEDDPEYQDAMRELRRSLGTDTARERAIYLLQRHWIGVLSFVWLVYYFVIRG
jgi:hypothetical protein